MSVREEIQLREKIRELEEWQARAIKHMEEEAEVLHLIHGATPGTDLLKQARAAIIYAQEHGWRPT